MLLHNICIDRIIAYYHRFLEISLHRIMIFMTMLLDRKKHLHPQRLTSEIGRRGIRRNGMFIFNQIIKLNVPLDTSLPVFKYNFKRLLKHNQIRDDLMS